MCSNFEGLLDPVRFADTFGVALPAGGRASVWPTYPSSFVMLDKAVEGGNGDRGARQRRARVGRFGMVPAWAGNSPKYAKLGLKTYNARCETVADKPSYRDAWRLGRHCIIAAEAIYEPDWRSGKATPARIARADLQPMGIAGLWTSYAGVDGNDVFSFTMLTINADAHPVFQNFHRPEDEKRMVVILQNHQFDDWLEAKPSDSLALMQPFAAADLMVNYPKLEQKAANPDKTLFNS